MTIRHNSHNSHNCPADHTAGLYPTAAAAAAAGTVPTKRSRVVDDDDADNACLTLTSDHHKIDDDIIHNNSRNPSSNDMILATAQQTMRMMNDLLVASQYATQQYTYMQPTTRTTPLDLPSVTNEQEKNIDIAVNDSNEIHLTDDQGEEEEEEEKSDNDLSDIAGSRIDNENENEADNEPHEEDFDDESTVDLENDLARMTTTCCADEEEEEEDGDEDIGTTTAIAAHRIPKTVNEIVEDSHSSVTLNELFPDHAERLIRIHNINDNDSHHDFNHVPDQDPHHRMALLKHSNIDTTLRSCNMNKNIHPAGTFLRRIVDSSTCGFAANTTFVLAQAIPNHLLQEGSVLWIPLPSSLLGSLTDDHTPITSSTTTKITTAALVAVGIITEILGPIRAPLYTVRIVLDDETLQMMMIKTNSTTTTANRTKTNTAHVDATEAMITASTSAITETVACSTTSSSSTTAVAADVDVNHNPSPSTPEMAIETTTMSNTTTSSTSTPSTSTSILLLEQPESSFRESHEFPKNVDLSTASTATNPPQEQQQQQPHSYIDCETLLDAWIHNKATVYYRSDDGKGNEHSGTASATATAASPVVVTRLMDVQAILRRSGRGCDASNVFDEEVDRTQQEFSDDEAEQRSKQEKKKSSSSSSHHSNTKHPKQRFPSSSSSFMRSKPREAAAYTHSVSPAQLSPLLSAHHVRAAPNHHHHHHHPDYYSTQNNTQRSRNRMPAGSISETSSFRRRSGLERHRSGHFGSYSIRSLAVNNEGYAAEQSQYPIHPSQSYHSQPPQMYTSGLAPSTSPALYPPSGFYPSSPPRHRQSSPLPSVPVPFRHDLQAQSHHDTTNHVMYNNTISVNVNADVIRVHDAATAVSNSMNQPSHHQQQLHTSYFRGQVPGTSTFMAMIATSQYYAQSALQPPQPPPPPSTNNDESDTIYYYDYS